MRRSISERPPAIAPAAGNLDADLNRIAALNIEELRRLWREAGPGTADGPVERPARPEPLDHRPEDHRHELWPAEWQGVGAGGGQCVADGTQRAISCSGGQDQAASIGRPRGRGASSPAASLGDGERSA